MATSTQTSDRLQSLLHASLLLNSTLGLDDVLRTLGLLAQKHTNAERVSLFLLDDDRETLIARIRTGGEVEEIRVKLGIGIVGKVAATGRSRRVAEARRSPDFDGSIDDRTGYRTQNLATVAVKGRDGRLVGVLQALNKDGGASEFTGEDVDYLTILASHAAVAIDNARTFDRAARERDELERDYLRLQQGNKKLAHEPLGEAPVFRAAVELALSVADSDANVLLRGESGSGKGVFAKLVHGQSHRSKGPFVSINCTAIPDALVESELFGIEKGVATGVEARKGRLESANGGTCFLDEIGDMALEAQAKVLKVLEDRCFERVGGRKSMPLDVRLVAATHRDLESMIEEGDFRADLYYRLNVVTIDIPALRDRGDDVLLLAERFAAEAAKRNRRPKPRLSDEFGARLRAYHWPGNVRELQNVIERAVVLGRGKALDEAHLPREFWRGDAPPPPAIAARDGSATTSLKDALARYEKSLLERALADCDGNRSAAARRLDLSESNMRFRMKKLGI